MFNEGADKKWKVLSDNVQSIHEIYRKVNNIKFFNTLFAMICLESSRFLFYN